MIIGVGSTFCGTRLTRNSASEMLRHVIHNHLDFFVGQSVRPVFLRWNIQCKNTANVRLDDVAKEVGLAVEMGSNVVVVVSTGKFSADAREHAKHVMARRQQTMSDAYENRLRAVHQQSTSARASGS